MSSREFTEWAAFARLDPFGPARADLRMANIMALTAEIHRDRKRRGRPYTPAEFMFEFDPELVAEADKPKGPRQLWRELKTWAMMAGAKSKKNEDQDAGSV